MHLFHYHWIPVTAFLPSLMFSATSNYPCYFIVGSGTLTPKQCSLLDVPLTSYMKRYFIVGSVPWICYLTQGHEPVVKNLHTRSMANNWEAIVWITSITLVIVWAKL